MRNKARKYARLFRRVLVANHFEDPARRAAAYERRLQDLYASDAFATHNVYPTMDVALVYAVIAMCLELRGYGLADQEIIGVVDDVFQRRRRIVSVLAKAIAMLPHCYGIVRWWNIDDHERRVRDGSITYDTFDVSDGKVEYRISKCMYVEMFDHYGIRSLCKVFCLTDVHAYANLARRVLFVRHSDLSCADSCHDEVIDRRSLAQEGACR